MVAGKSTWLTWSIITRRVCRSSLTFTTSNYDKNQLVTLQAAEDDSDTANETATIRCSASTLTSVDIAATTKDNDTTVCTVTSVTIFEFWPPKVFSGETVYGGGEVVGTGSGIITYYWRGRNADGSGYDSGALTVQMTNGAAMLDDFSGFPTSKVGFYRMHIEVTSPTMIQSAAADYEVIFGGHRLNAVSPP